MVKLRFGRALCLFSICRFVLKMCYLKCSSAIVAYCFPYLLLNEAKERAIWGCWEDAGLGGMLSWVPSTDEPGGSAVGKENTADNTTERRVVSISRISLALSAIDSLLLSKDNPTFFPQRGSTHRLLTHHRPSPTPFTSSMFLEWITGMLESMEGAAWIRNTSR